jgi:hypothetical protein
MTTILARPAPRPSRPLERLRRRVLEPFFTRLGYDLVPAVPEWEHRPLSRREVERLVGQAAGHLEADMAAAGIAPREAPGETVAAFLDLIAACPVRQKRGGNGFNGSLQVYAVVRALRPSVIVESGVFRGLTTWLMRQAVPDATILCFDPNLGNLHYRDPHARYSTDDWSSAGLSGLDLTDALAFFDDHISQARRIVEASDRGIRRVLFDDNAAAHRIHGHGGPAYPTLSMVLDDEPGEPIRWTRNGREFAYLPDPAMLADARARIETAHDFDDLHAATGYSPARISYVALRA